MLVKETNKYTDLLLYFSFHGQEFLFLCYIWQIHDKINNNYVTDA